MGGPPSSRRTHKFTFNSLLGIPLVLRPGGYTRFPFFNSLLGIRGCGSSTRLGLDPFNSLLGYPPYSRRAPYSALSFNSLLGILSSITSLTELTSELSTPFLGYERTTRRLRRRSSGFQLPSWDTQAGFLGPRKGSHFQLPSWDTEAWAFQVKEDKDLSTPFLGYLEVIISLPPWIPDFQLPSWDTSSRALRSRR